MAGLKDRLPPSIPPDAHSVDFVINGNIMPTRSGARRTLSKPDLEFLTDPLERLFAELVIKAGLWIAPGPHIESPYPVKDKHGNPVLRIFNPDFTVMRPRRRGILSAVVEVGHMLKPSTRKEAQMRVARAAGVPVFKIRETDIHTLNHMVPVLLRRRLIDMFCLKNKKKTSVQRIWKLPPDR